MKISQLDTAKFRFILVGGINTAIDFSILFILTFLGLDKIISNYFSTGIALIFSFFANKSFTFQNKNGAVKRQFLLFLIITLTGLWVLQPLVIWSTSSLLSPFIANSFLLLFVTKILATIVSLIWNYIFYSRLVFKE